MTISFVTGDNQDFFTIPANADGRTTARWINDDGVVAATSPAWWYPAERECFIPREWWGDESDYIDPESGKAIGAWINADDELLAVIVAGAPRALLRSAPARRADTLSSMELRARRAALGLSQAELASLLGRPRPVLSTWESGTRRPRRPAVIIAALEVLEDVLERLINDLVDKIEDASDLTGSRIVVERAYEADEDWWAADAAAREARLPASLHRVALARAAVRAREAGIGLKYATGVAQKG